MSKSNCKTKSDNVIKATRTIAPEDLRVGDYVAITQVVVELPSFLWDRDAVTDIAEPVRMPWMPCDGGLPRRVVDVCLPFVFVKEPDGSHNTLDTRTHRLARLSEDYAKTALKRLKADRKREAKELADLLKA